MGLVYSIRSVRVRLTISINIRFKQNVNSDVCIEFTYIREKAHWKLEKEGRNRSVCLNVI